MKTYYKLTKLDLIMTLVNTFIFTWGQGNQTIIEEEWRKAPDHSGFC